MEEDIKELAQKKVEELCDSIAIGSASKGGVIKIYGDFSKTEGFVKKIDNAKKIKAYAQANLAINI